MGAGLAGLSTGYVLAKAGKRLTVFEGDPSVGGLSRTVNHHGFLFDLGGHRFLTNNRETEQFVLDLLRDDYLVVPRKSQIFMFDRYFDYPLKPLNAAFGFGMLTTLKILIDYIAERLKRAVRKPDIVSLEDWVVSQFGRKMFDLYFKEYSEKVWGLGCHEISKEWVAERIKGLSLWSAVKNSLFSFSRKKSLTLYDTFYYPRLGIGQLSERLREGIEENPENLVLTRSRVTRVNHDQNRVRSIVIDSDQGPETVIADNFVSSLPLTNLLSMLSPSPPKEIMAAVARLKFRDLVLVTIMLDRERVTDLTWMYLPGKDIPLGRIHEPKNWSPQMAPDHKTHIVAEYFCFKDDCTWGASDHELTTLTVTQLVKLGFIKENEVIDSCVLRIPKAYPIFDVGYRQHYDAILAYLAQFTNLHIVGRGGKFRYYNMDRAIESGIETAKQLLKKPPQAGK